MRTAALHVYAALSVRGNDARHFGNCTALTCATAQHITHVWHAGIPIHCRQTQNKSHQIDGTLACTLLLSCNAAQAVQATWALSETYVPPTANVAVATAYPSRSLRETTPAAAQTHWGKARDVTLMQSAAAIGVTSHRQWVAKQAAVSAVSTCAQH